MSMPDPQLKRKLKKREQSRLRVLQKKSEGKIWNAKFDCNVPILMQMSTSLIDPSGEEDQEAGLEIEKDIESKRKLPFVSILRSFH